MAEVTVRIFPDEETAYSGELATFSASSVRMMGSHCNPMKIALNLNIRHLLIFICMRKDFVSISFIALALLGMAACTKTENGTEDKGADDLTTQYLAVRISNVKSPATRAGEEFEYGTEKEQAITNVRFYFFNQDGTPFRLSNNANHNWLEKTAADLAPIDGKTHQDGTPDGNVEETTSAVLLIQGNTGASPYALIAVINPATMTVDGANPLLDGNGVAKDLSLSQKTNNSVITNEKGIEDKEAAKNSQAAQSNKMMMLMMPLMSLWIDFTVPCALSLT